MKKFEQSRIEKNNHRKELSRSSSKLEEQENSKKNIYYRSMFH